MARQATGQRAVAPPDDVAPVEPLVPVLLLAPAEPLEGVVAVELPEAPMPDVVFDEEPAALGVLELVLGDMEPLAVPPADPMPEAVPEADPDMPGEEPQAARERATAMEAMVLIM
ncbi:MAG TPA: hypothetical protein VLJ86_26690 [Ramlibacter sp.]|nr:hypothetical protein [Ramlibacter sp.]